MDEESDEVDESVFQDDNNRLKELLNLELRNVSPSKINKLSSIIDQVNKGWTSLLNELSQPVTQNRPFPRLDMLPEHVNLIEQQYNCGKSPTLALLNHWSITGRRRPTILSLLALLRVCNFRRAEDYVCREWLNVQPDEQTIKQANANSPKFAPVVNHFFKCEDLDSVVKEIDSECPRFIFHDLSDSTNGFSDEPFVHQTQAGFKVGEGGFGSVFRALARQESGQNVNEDEVETQLVAAKLLKSECNTKFLSNEINLMIKVKHVNILEFLGISISKPDADKNQHMCLLYPYMDNGSLRDCLKYGLPTRDNQMLSWSDRVDIAIKTARAIHYLHTFELGAIIHRDIKTANIFLDNKLHPKIGDFSLVRQLKKFRTTQTQRTEANLGTGAYMPPEANRGDISTKFDTFSFGVVIFELITGMGPLIENSDEDLLTYIRERLPDDHETNVVALHDFITSIIDREATCCNLDQAKILFKLGMEASEDRKKFRPEITELLPKLELVVDTSP